MLLIGEYILYATYQGKAAHDFMTLNLVVLLKCSSAVCYGTVLASIR